MSKNSKKASTAHNTSKRDIKKFIYIGIMIAVALGLGIAILLITMPPTSTPSLSEDEQEMLKIQEAQDYLKNKYGQNFLFHEQTLMYYVFSVERDKNTIYEQADSIFYVSSKEMMRRAYTEESIASYFTEEFCDGAYFVLAESEIRQYFDQFIPESFGNHTILLYFTSSVLPSSVTTNTPFDTLVKTYPDFLSCEMYLLTDQDISQDDLKALSESLSDTGIRIIVRVNKIDAEYQKNRNVSEFAIGWSKNETSLMQAYINWPESEE